MESALGASIILLLLPDFPESAYLVLALFIGIYHSAANNFSRAMVIVVTLVLFFYDWGGTSFYAQIAANVTNATSPKGGAAKT